MKLFCEKCKGKGLAYFDFMGLYGDIPSDTFYGIDRGRRRGGKSK